jgi:3'-phosphoadenosine 5'-phosphosulfate (PAPS) 3'-phosphatase
MEVNTMQTEYILKAMDAALAAGKEILNVYNDPSSDFQVERKADNSPLTLADRKAHETIMTYLQETDYPVLSEEGKHLPYEKRAQWDTLWIVDPLDGTKEFIKRNGEFTVNIALVKEGVPVFGVIYVPVKETAITIFTGRVTALIMLIGSIADTIKILQCILVSEFSKNTEFIIFEKQLRLHHQIQAPLEHYRNSHRQHRTFLQGIRRIHTKCNKSTTSY